MQTLPKRTLIAGSRSLEKRSVKDLRMLLARELSKVRTHVRKTQEVPNLDRLTSRLTDRLQRVMVIQHVVGLKTTVDILRKNGIQLDFYSDLLNALNRTTRVNVSQLQEIYRQNAFVVASEYTDHINTQLREFVNDLIPQNLPIKSQVEELQKKFDALGLTPRNSYSLENIARTQSQLAFNAGKYVGEQDPAFQEILWGYEYSTVGDDRVRDEHAELEGVLLPKNHVFWSTFYPPNGWSCRCAVIPVFDEPEQIKLPQVEVQIDERFSFNPGEFLLTL